MLTYYCPSCWHTLAREARTCPDCGFELSRLESMSYEERLLMTAFHPVPEIRRLAISILGRVGTSRALPVLERIIQDEKKDVYIVLESLQALARMGETGAQAILEEAVLHPFPVVRRWAKELLEWRLARSA